MAPQTPESLGFLVSQICRLEHARAHELLETLGLYRGQHRMLHALWEQDGLTHGELATRSHVRPPTITKTIQRMEDAGLVLRRDDAQDQRISRVYLTETGRSLKDDVEGTWQQLDDEMFAGFTMEERTFLRRFFLQILENLISVTRKEKG